MSYGEAAALIRELGKEWGSHYQASVQGWQFVMTYAEWAAALHLETYVEVHRDPEKVPQRFVFPKPWNDHDAASMVTDEERAALVEQLTRRSAFRDR